jgi:predicted metalloprotease
MGLPGGLGGLGGLFQKRTGRPVRRGGGSSIMMIVIALGVMYFLGIDPRALLQGGLPGGGTATTQRPAQPGAVQKRSPAEDQMADFISVVLADTEDTWNTIFSQSGKRYQEPRLVLFTGAAQSACGFAQAAMGPFYCPADQKVYIDLSFYEDMKTRHGVSGDFAQAYVVAHEVGHHVQNLLGISDKVQSMRQRISKSEGNQLSVRLELQADCFAGVWGNHANRSRQILEQGDIEEALRAATSIGDDRLQKQSRGYITPESFTHGTSEQRVRWFKTGIQFGDLSQCNTFETNRL